MYGEACELIRKNRDICFEFISENFPELELVFGNLPMNSRASHSFLIYVLDYLNV